MLSGQISEFPKSVQLAWRFGATVPRNLSLVLEKQARSMRDAAALLLPYPDIRGSSPKFISIGFRKLIIEQNAWVNYLHNQGVRKGDAAIVWLPLGPSFIAVSYALFKIGAHAIVLDPDFNWKVGYGELQKLEPQHMIGTRSTLSYAKGLTSELNEPVNRIEVEKPQGFVGSAIRSFQTRSTTWEQDENLLTIVRTAGQRCSSACFDQEQLCQLATYYKDWFDLREGDRGLPGNVLEALLFPAAGLTSLVVGELFSEGTSRSGKKLLVEAVEQFGLQLISGEARFWRGIAGLAEQGILQPRVQFEAVVHGTGVADCGLDTISSTLPGVKINLLFGSVCNPFISSRRWGEHYKQGGSDAYRGVYLGKPLPGLQVSLLPCEDLRWPEEPMAATPLGEIATAKQDYAPLGARDCWDESGELGFFDFGGGLWHCGNKEDIVVTSFGGFCPVRCEIVFNRHPRVKRSALIALSKNGKTRPGLVIETELGELPKRGIEESRFKAELLQLAMDIEETSLIVDIYFSDRLPLEYSGFEGLDRRRLSKEYSKRLRY